GDLEGVNKAWWATFWSHRYSDWDEIEPVDPSNNGLMLDWQRYNSDQVLDFYLMEIAPLRKFTPNIPITTNFMRPDVGLDYWKIAEHVDVVCWDSYPEWHVYDDVQTALETAFYHDLHRSYKQGQPFYLIESSPSQTNWQPLSRLKRPGLLKLASAQALAHGAMGVNYFQWRQSRGGEEKFHGAVVAHRGGETSRVFQEVREVGELLAALPELAAAHTPARVGIVYDYENEWASNLAYLPRKVNREYQKTCIQHYAHFWRRGIPVDILNTRQSLDGYALVIAPMLYMLGEETAARLAKFVASGGALVTTYLTGWVNESDLCHQGASPLDEVLGLTMVEFDTFGDNQPGQVVSVDGNALGLAGSGACGRYAELLEPKGAEVLAVYASEFYKGKAVLTVNSYGQGKAYHLGAYLGDAFLGEFYQCLVRSHLIEPVLPGAIPIGVSIQTRQTDQKQYLFLLNFTEREQGIELESEDWIPLSEEKEGAQISLPGYGVKVFVKDLEKSR
ncbi:MAG TPA: beta-galactosidase, partial [Anaerolineales bacterium]|nr:beta-galactosidase [Anaerolineales bacterium]